MHKSFPFIFLQIKTVLFFFCLQHFHKTLFALQTTIHSPICDYTIVINRINSSQCPNFIFNQQKPERKRQNSPKYKHQNNKNQADLNNSNEDNNNLFQSRGDLTDKNLETQQHQQDLTDVRKYFYRLKETFPSSDNISWESRSCQRRLLSLMNRLERLQRVQRIETQKGELYANSVKGHNSQLNFMGASFEKLENNVSSLVKAVHSIEQKLFRLKKINQNLEHKMASVVLDIDEVNKNMGRRHLKATSDFSEFQEKQEKSEHSMQCQKIPRGMYTYEDCSDLKKAGYSQNGEYFIQPSALSCSVRVWCDMETDGGGWTTFQRRTDGTENFFRNWTDYRDGFGLVTGEFWWGNNNLFLLTNQKKYELRVELWDFHSASAFAKYRHFKLDGERDNFRIHVSGYTGTARNGLYLLNYTPFSTLDRDNDKHRYENCARKWDGGWWFTNCWDTYLNGRYHGKSDVRVRGISWNSWKHEQLKGSEMKIRPVTS